MKKILLVGLLTGLFLVGMIVTVHATIIKVIFDVYVGSKSYHIDIGSAVMDQSFEPFNTVSFRQACVN